MSMHIFERPIDPVTVGVARDPFMRSPSSRRARTLGRREPRRRGYCRGLDQRIREDLVVHIDSPATRGNREVPGSAGASPAKPLPTHPRRRRPRSATPASRRHGRLALAGRESHASPEPHRELHVLGEGRGQVAAFRRAHALEIVGAHVGVVGDDEGARPEAPLHEAQDPGIEGFAPSSSTRSIVSGRSLPASRARRPRESPRGR